MIPPPAPRLRPIVAVLPMSIMKLPPSAFSAEINEMQRKLDEQKELL